MKAFEEWWIQNMPNDMRYESAYHKALLEDGWRAALEWVLSRVQHANSDGSIISDIEKELEE